MATLWAKLAALYQTKFQSIVEAAVINGIASGGAALAAYLVATPSASLWVAVSAWIGGFGAGIANSLFKIDPAKTS